MFLKRLLHYSSSCTTLRHCKAVTNYRTLHSTSPILSKARLSDKNRKNKWAKKEDRMLGQLSHGMTSVGKQKKNKWQDIGMGSLLPNSSSYGKHFTPSLGAQRRVKRLNVVLFDHITAILGSGEVAPELLDMGFHILQVDIANDFHIINVRWHGTGTEKDQQIELLLPKCEADLRSSLIKLRVMGQVPRVQFVKDLTDSRLNEIERLLASADMGPDHEPTELGYDLKDYHARDSRPPKIQQSFESIKINLEKHDWEDGEVGPTGAREVMMTKSREVVKDQDEIVDHDFKELDFASDAYNLDRAELAALVMQTKKRAEHRNKTFEDKLQEGEKKELNMGNVGVKDIKKVLSAKQRKKFEEGIDIRKVRHKGWLLSPQGLDMMQGGDEDIKWSRTEEVEEQDNYHVDDEDTNNRP